MQTLALSQGLVLVSAILAQVHHSQMLGPALKFGHPCWPCLHEAVHASFTCMRSSVQTLKARGAEEALSGLVPCPPGLPSGGYACVVKMNPPEGARAGHVTSLLSELLCCLCLEAAWTASCNLRRHGQPQDNKASMDGQTSAAGAACDCGARGPR